ncbi:hypothetical protein FRC19_001242 [Serendipita sp. 401]|nr:hypothetical protein FRC19_001242 [Serendipita sp. 401]
MYIHIKGLKNGLASTTLPLQPHSSFLFAPTNSFRPFHTLAAKFTNKNTIMDYTYDYSEDVSHTKAKAGDTERWVTGLSGLLDQSKTAKMTLRELIKMDTTVLDIEMKKGTVTRAELEVSFTFPAYISPPCICLPLFYISFYPFLCGCSRFWFAHDGANPFGSGPRFYKRGWKTYRVLIVPFALKMPKMGFDLHFSFLVHTLLFCDSVPYLSWDEFCNSPLSITPIDAHLDATCLFARLQCLVLCCIARYGPLF